jgi:prevent-host-death family protein
MSWNIAQAKQRFSEIVRRTIEGPQLIYNRNRLVAAVINAEDYRAFKEWSERNAGRTLAEEFTELRQIMQKENYELPQPPRSTRRNRFAETLEEDRELPG